MSAQTENTQPSETEERTAKARQAAHIKRQAWALYGQLVLKGYITPPDWPALHVGEIMHHAFSLSADLAEMENILGALDQQVVEEFDL